jgi:hypothetical protein
MKLLGLGAAAALAVQVIVLSWPSAQGMIAAGAVALLAWQLWTVRSHLNEHVDMLILMTGYGGLGMLPWTGSCHLTSSAWLWMTAGMLTLGLPAALAGSRCIRRALKEGNLVQSLAAESIGMTAAMLLVHRLVTLVAHDPLMAHIAMLVGMLMGMTGASFALQRRIDRHPA